MQDQVFFVGQKAFIRNEKGEILILIDRNIGIDLPGGKVQEGEIDLITSLKREVKEETNLEVNPFNVWHTWTFQYPMREDIRDQRTSGNLYLVGYICDIVSGTLQLSDEHVAYKWVNKDSLEHEEHRGHYQAVKYYFDNYKDA